jgi:NAD(P)-dependent dehydrogenase (short-subunit alcohol dehydrogenase family)
MLVRNNRGPRLADELIAETGNPHVSTIGCDLADFDRIRAAALEVERQQRNGDIPALRRILANAGLQITGHHTSAGLETTFAVNVLANYVLIRQLTDLLVTPARILVVGSDTHFADFRHNLGMVPALRWSTAAAAAAPNPRATSVRDAMRVYARSKLGVIYLVHEFARRLPDGIDIYTYNPGGVPGTGLSRNASRPLHVIQQVLMRALVATPFATDLDTAGRLMAQTMTGDSPGESGSYIDRGNVTASSAESYDRQREANLWQFAAQTCGD